MGSEGGVLSAAENHCCEVLALPTDSENPTDLAGYPKINSHQGTAHLTLPLIIAIPTLWIKVRNITMSQRPEGERCRRSTVR